MNNDTITIDLLNLEQIQKDKPPIILDGRNIAYNIGGEPNWELSLKAAKFFYNRGFRVTIVMPHWIPEDYKKQHRKVANIQLVDIGKDREFDDKLVLGLCLVEDGYFVSNDKRISKHMKGGVDNRAWCNSRRIGFEFDTTIQFIPILPDNWISFLIQITQTEEPAIKRQQEVKI